VTDLLPSWREGATKDAIVAFVESVSNEGGTAFVPRPLRVAVFDNDGTLWCEKPMPIQADFLFRRIGEMAAADPSLGDRQPWKAVVEKDFQWLGGAITKHYHGDDSDLNVMAGGLLAAYDGVTIEDFESRVVDFFHDARHPTLDRPYLGCGYRPMIELLRYLEANGFANYIASGGGRDFMRPITEGLYGIAPDRVIGSSVELEFRDDGGAGQIVHTAKVDIFDDGAAKPVRIWSRVGRRPIFAAGNSNGDLQMLQFAGGSSLPPFRLLVLHDDAEREFDYTAGAEAVLDAARAEGWTIASVKDDWTDVFADPPQ
jgi:phosphoglycolate phosphatase-like HAD superfamily hydrolase